MNTEQSLLGKRAHISATARKPTADSDGAVNHASSGDDFSKVAETKASKKLAEKPKGGNKREKNGAEHNIGSENNLDDLSSFNSNDQDDESGNDDAAATNQ